MHGAEAEGARQVVPIDAHFHLLPLLKHLQSLGPLLALSSRFRIVLSHQFGMTKQTRYLVCPPCFLWPKRCSTPVQCPASGRPVFSSQDADLQL
ncbi:hypothetical protein ONE63_005432 [Megalurothrips usitatus]|uniref:Uncharacterized protein n=1 Tax=Megalurothrips usitatus TaxID=439358 RepID=A0AAV7XVE7_9NEOP|nr:hypothetical protein ONE63_005432 [Megalurothrips usitatus]